MRAFVALGLAFSTPSQEIGSGETSPRLSVSCRVGRKTTTRVNINLLGSEVVRRHQGLVDGALSPSRAAGVTVPRTRAPRHVPRHRRVLRERHAASVRASAAPYDAVRVVAAGGTAARRLRHGRRRRRRAAGDHGRGGPRGRRLRLGEVRER